MTEMLEPPFRFGEITMHPEARQVFVRDSSLAFTAREFEILILLARSEAPLRREEIYERVWGIEMSRADRSVDVVIRKMPPA
jgi:DNA-binding response OmpR family regulator